MIAREAGTIVKSAFNIPNKKVDYKFDKNDLVTETDRQVEKLIFSKLKGLFPSHKYVKNDSPHKGLLARRLPRGM